MSAKSYAPAPAAICSKTPWPTTWWLPCAQSRAARSARPPSLPAWFLALEEKPHVPSALVPVYLKHIGDFVAKVEAETAVAR